MSQTSGIFYATHSHQGVLQRPWVLQSRHCWRQHPAPGMRCGFAMCLGGAMRPWLHPTARNKILFSIHSRANQIPLSSVILFFPPLDHPPNISKAECPKSTLLGTVLSFSHRGFVLLGGAGWDQDLPNWCEKITKNGTEQQSNMFFLLFFKGRCCSGTLDMSSTSRKLLMIIAVGTRSCFGQGLSSWSL